MPNPVWYFDFVSPYAYLQFSTFPAIFEDTEVTLKPVVFSGLLAHWGHKGPAEIPSKRIHTYRALVWQSRQLGIPFSMPPAHPFNPVPALRLALALGCTANVVREIFDFIWKDGHSVDADWALLCTRLGVQNAESLISDPVIKSDLRRNGEEALTVGVFGVPSFVVDGQIFWGMDNTARYMDYRENPALFSDAEMQRVSALPATAQRRF